MRNSSHSSTLEHDITTKHCVVTVCCVLCRSVWGMHTARCCYVGTSVLLDISVLHRNSKTTTISCSRLGQCRGCSRLLLYILITISVICPRVSHATSAAANYSKYVTRPHKLSSYLRCSLSVLIIMSCHCLTLLLFYLCTGPKYPPQ